MTKTNGIVTTMEFTNIHYTDVPNVIKKCLLNGFEINDICKNRINGCHYNIVAYK